MSLAGLFDHRVRVWRPTESETDLGAAETLAPIAAAPTRPNAALVPPKFRLSDPGAGERSSGVLQGFMAAEADVAERDVLEVLSGPESPAKLRVVSTSRPRSHHTELQLEPYPGELGP